MRRKGEGRQAHKERETKGKIKPTDGTQRQNDPESLQQGAGEDDVQGVCC